MTRDRLPERNQVLAARLRCEARESQPAFSEELHARICRALEQAEGARPPERRLAAGWRSAVYAALAASLTVAAALSVVAWRWSPPSPPQPDRSEAAARPVRSPHPGDLSLLSEVADQAFQQVAVWAEADPGSQLLAQLDRDARVAAELLLDQVPIALARSEGP